MFNFSGCFAFKSALVCNAVESASVFTTQWGGQSLSNDVAILFLTILEGGRIS